jgi:hypothetical protein
MHQRQQVYEQHADCVWECECIPVQRSPRRHTALHQHHQDMLQVLHKHPTLPFLAYTSISAQVDAAMCCHSLSQRAGESKRHHAGPRTDVREQGMSGYGTSIFASCGINACHHCSQLFPSQAVMTPTQPHSTYPGPCSCCNYLCRDE